MPIVGDVFNKITSKPVIVNAHDGIKKIHKELLQSNPVFRCVYVVDDNNKLIGKITLQEILKVVAIRKGIADNKSHSVRSLFEFIAKDLSAKDIMSAPIFVKLSDSLEEALQKIINAKVEEVAVLDDENRIIGDLNAYELLSEMELL